MSLKERLGAMTQGLGEVAAPAKPPAADGEAPRPPRTGPGQMLATRGLMQETNKELERLRAQLEEYAGSVPAKPVDAATVAPSKYANRHEDEFKSKEFLQLKEEIERAGRNVQPILVRAVTGREKVQFEVIFGLRRLRACQELGIPVWIIIVAATDEELFFAMEMENRQRKNPSPFEMGDSYRRALEDGLFTSIRQLATRLHIDFSLAAKAYSIATLPAEVLRAFPSPTVVQYRWGKLLSDAIQKDPEGVTARAEQIIAAGRNLGGKEVLGALLGTADGGQADRDRALRVDGVDRTFGRLQRGRKGALTVSIDPGAVPEEKVQELEAVIVKFLAKLYKS